MSWLYSRVLVEEYLGDNCSDGEPSVPLSGSSTPQAYCAPDKMKDFSRISRFGMTFKPLTESRGEELLTLYLEDFRAKTSVVPEKELESKDKKVECGRNSQELLARYDPSTSLWRTAQCSLLEDLEQSLETWPRWGSMRNGACYQQPMLAQITSEIESGLLPDNETFFHTPNTTGLDGGSNSRKALEKRMGMWPTPLTQDSYERSSWKVIAEANEGGKARLTLTRKVKYMEKKWPSPFQIGTPTASMTKRSKKFRGAGGRTPTPAEFVESWPTPTAHNAKETNAPSEANRNTPTLAAQAGGQLNPTWVEWLMGWPLGWTDLKPLEMDKSLCVQQQPLNYLKRD